MSNHNDDPLKAIENKHLRTKVEALEKECEKLQIALRMITGEDKADLLSAVDRVKMEREVLNTWVSAEKPSAASITVYTGTTAGAVTWTTQGI